MLNAASYGWQPISNNLCCWCVRRERDNVRQTRITTVWQEVVAACSLCLAKRRNRKKELEWIEFDKRRNAAIDSWHQGAADKKKGMIVDLDDLEDVN